MRQKSTYKARSSGQKTWPADLFQEFKIQIPKHDVPRIKELASDLGVPIERVMAYSAMTPVNTGYAKPFKVPDNYHASHEINMKIFSLIASVRKGISYDHMMMLSSHLSIGSYDIIAALRDLKNAGDIEQFTIEGQTLGAFRISSTHKHSKRGFKKFAGESQGVR